MHLYIMISYGTGSSALYKDRKLSTFLCEFDIVLTLFYQGLSFVFLVNASVLFQDNGLHTLSFLSNSHEADKCFPGCLKLKDAINILY